MKFLVTFLAIICCCLACDKVITNASTIVDNSPKFITYKIGKGQNYSNNDSTLLIFTNYTVQNFIARFDSSVIYTTVVPSHQTDINKLYGFADNNMFHQVYSARFGWNWLKDGLHLWGYNYNNGVIDSISTVTNSINKDINCSIKVLPNNYIFSVDGKETYMLRTSPTAMGVGYKLFPYFGGHEPAPHDITILIKEL